MGCVDVHVQTPVACTFSVHPVARQSLSVSPNGKCADADVGRGRGGGEGEGDDFFALSSTSSVFLLSEAPDASESSGLSWSSASPEVTEVTDVPEVRGLKLRTPNPVGVVRGDVGVEGVKGKKRCVCVSTTNTTLAMDNPITTNPNTILYTRINTEYPLSSILFLLVCTQASECASKRWRQVVRQLPPARTHFAAKQLPRLCPEFKRSFCSATLPPTPPCRRRHRHRTTHARTVTKNSISRTLLHPAKATSSFHITRQTSLLRIRTECSLCPSSHLRIELILDAIIQSSCAPSDANRCTFQI